MVRERGPGRLSAKQLQMALAVPLLAVLLPAEMRALAAHHGGQFALGLALYTPLIYLSPAPVFAVNYALRGRTVLVTVGFGPLVWRGMTPTRVVRVNAVPLGITGSFVPAVANFDRDMRILTAARLASPLLLACAAVAFLPIDSSIPLAALLVFQVMAWGLARRTPEAPTPFARVFRGDVGKRDEDLTPLAAAESGNAYWALEFGDLEAAERAADELAGNPVTAFAADALRMEVLIVRGEYRAVLGIVPTQSDLVPPLIRRRRLFSLELARRYVVLLSAEAAPQLSEKAADMVAGWPEKIGRTVTDLYPPRTRALFLLLVGRAAEAATLNKRELRRAATPLALSSALCTQARIEAALGRPGRAAKALERAHRFAPWHARVAIVRWQLGLDQAPAVDLPAPADTAALFEDPWAVSDPAS